MSRLPSHTRRRLLATLAAGTLAPGAVLAGVRDTGVASSVAPGKMPRVVVLDWGLTAQVMSLGVVPVGIARPLWYRLLGGLPALPTDVADVGLLFQPNFEVVQALRPDLIVVTPQHAAVRDALARIARVVVVPDRRVDEDGWQLIRRRVRLLGEAMGRIDVADAVLVQTDARLQAAKQRMASLPAAQAPIFLMRPLDLRFAAVYGSQSLFGGTLRALGLTCAWPGRGDGDDMAQVDYGALGNTQGAQALLLGVAPSALTTLDGSPLWRALPFVQQHRVRHVPQILPSGGTATVTRLADALFDTFSGAPA